MDWSDIIRKAAAMALNGTITFSELDALVSQRDCEPEDIEDLLLALEAEGIQLVEDDSDVS